jgi:hypothetical protein
LNQPIDQKLEYTWEMPYYFIGGELASDFQNKDDIEIIRSKAALAKINQYAIFEPIYNRFIMVSRDMSALATVLRLFSNKFPLMKLCLLNTSPNYKHFRESTDQWISNDCCQYWGIEDKVTFQVLENSQNVKTVNVVTDLGKLKCYIGDEGMGPWELIAKEKESMFLLYSIVKILQDTIDKLTDAETLGMHTDKTNLIFDRSMYKFINQDLGSDAYYKIEKLEQTKQTLYQLVFFTKDITSIQPQLRELLIPHGIDIDSDQFRGNE